MNKFKQTIARGIFIVATCGFLSSCVYQSFKEGERVMRNFISVSKAGWQVTYRGRIHQQGFEHLKEVFDKSTLEQGKPPVSLLISSSGGSAAVGLAMGEWVRDNKLTVQVGRRCKSACANYVFTAGVKKILEENSTLIWHGAGLIQESTEAGISRGVIHKYTKKEIDKHYAQAVAQNTKLSRAEFEKVFLEEMPKLIDKAFKQSGEWQKVRELQLDFYKSINTAPLIGDYGFLQNPNFKDENFSGFYYSLDDLAYLGVTNIELKTGKWHPDVKGEAFLVERKYFKNWQKD